MSLSYARDHNVGIHDHVPHRHLLDGDSGLHGRLLGLRDNDSARIRRGLRLARQPIDRATRIGLVGVIDVDVVHVEVPIRQHDVLATDVGVRVQVHARVLHPRGDHHNLGHVRRHLALEQGRVPRQHVLVMNLHRVLLIDNCGGVGTEKC